MLVIITAEEVRDGEPRWWLGDEESRWDYVKADHLHLSACGDDTATRAIVDRPAPTPGLDLDAIDIPCDSEVIQALRARLAEATAAAVALAAEADGLRAEVARLTAKLTEVRELIDSTEHESTCTIGPYGPGQNSADCNCLVGAIAAALEAL